MSVLVSEGRDKQREAWKESFAPSHAQAVAQRLARKVDDIVKRCISVAERGSIRSVEVPGWQKLRGSYFNTVLHL
jgi:hypothetical protein